MRRAISFILERTRSSDSQPGRASPPTYYDDDFTAPTPAVARKNLDSAFKQYGQVLLSSTHRRPESSGSDDSSLVKDFGSSSLLDDLRYLGIQDVETIFDLIKAKKAHESNDKTYLMERIIQLAAELPSHSKSGLTLTNNFVKELWDDLQHPPQMFLGDKYAYRQADGSHNNVLHPQLGAANTPYARTVRPQTVGGPLPDPGVLFDSLMARKNYEEHPTKISSMLFYLASVIVHDIFRTDHLDHNNSKTSSYLELSPLYGSNQAEQDSIRTFSDGKLKPDCFTETRLLAFPPGVGCLLIMFNRSHNYVAEQLAAINEGGRFNKPSERLDAESRERAYRKYDNDLFQTARLVVCGLYVNIILLDYVRVILNINRTDSLWHLDPRADTGDGSPVGIGNQVSVEFNLLYRWHSAMSQQDEKWTEELYEKLFPGRKPSEVSMHEFLRTLGKMQHSLSKDPIERDFAGLKRQTNGRFDDDDLVKILTESIEDCAGSFGANRVPTVLKAVEILGIQQARQWGVASLNEFRKFFRLKPYETFEEINPDPYVAEQLRHLYQHPDFVELYPGLVVEEAKKPMVPGSGLCPSFTVSRAILSDAVALVRGDRFYTVDYHPRKLTNWGYNEVHYDTNVDQGCMFYKLFLRAFPNHFRHDSIYAHFPLTIPSENKIIMTDLGQASNYSWDRPARMPQSQTITSYTGARFILDGHQSVNDTWKGAMEGLLEEKAEKAALSRALMAKNQEFPSPEDCYPCIKRFFENVTINLLRRNCYKIAGISQVDVCKDIGNPAQVRFCAEIFGLPLKTDKQPNGLYSEEELFAILSLIYAVTFVDLESGEVFSTRQATRSVAKDLGSLVEGYVRAVYKYERSTDNSKPSNIRGCGASLIRRMLSRGLHPRVIALSEILPAASSIVSNQGRMFAEALDFYLSEEGRAHLPELQRLSKLDTAEADEQILHYGLEGSRLATSARVQRETTSGFGFYEVSKLRHSATSSRIVIDMAKVCRDNRAFADADQVRLDRPLEAYIHLNCGPHALFLTKIAAIALTTMLKTIFRLDNLRRAPGQQGELNRIKRAGGSDMYMSEDYGRYFAYPTSMKINWDGEIE
ncbi:heme peroxidase [Xylona heveae TC161]|uniref:Heme peroxidase n=1 Tax=Xylona heveae (strain CBS 132557 / TC161) TaxID=1328760 RepID=A0A165A3H6_XYLHT|nr:heme peroxidase [Xylona heveae TC161]KZF19901.1 heme peroxidase [Xylona heveae TC161]